MAGTVAPGLAWLHIDGPVSSLLFVECERGLITYRIVAMTLGRPPMVSKPLADTMPYPAAADDEYLPAYPGDSQRERRSSIMDFYVKNLELYDIVSQILEVLYVHDDKGPNKNHNTSQPAQLPYAQMGTILQLDQRLMNLANSLPPHLELPKLEYQGNDTMHRQATVFRIRYVSRSSHQDSFTKDTKTPPCKAPSGSTSPVSTLFVGNRDLYSGPKVGRGFMPVDDSPVLSPLRPHCP